MTVGNEYRFSIIAMNSVGQIQSNIVSTIVSDLPIAPAQGPQLVIAETSTDKISVSLSALDHTNSS
jgi:hypothetical protein